MTINNLGPYAAEPPIEPNERADRRTAWNNLFATQTQLRQENQALAEQVYESKLSLGRVYGGMFTIGVIGIVYAVIGSPVFVGFACSAFICMAAIPTFLALFELGKYVVHLCQRKWQQWQQSRTTPIGILGAN